MLAVNSWTVFVICCLAFEVNSLFKSLNCADEVVYPQGSLCAKLRLLRGPHGEPGPQAAQGESGKDAECPAKGCILPDIRLKGEPGAKGLNCSKSCVSRIPGPRGVKGEPGSSNLFAKENFEAIENIVGKIDILPLLALREEYIDDYEHDDLSIMDQLTSSIYRERNNKIHSTQTKIKMNPHRADKLKDEEKLWLLAPLVLGKSKSFPLLHSRRSYGAYEKKVFIAAYPHPIQGGELGGWAQSEKTCRDAGQSYFRDGGFRALLSTIDRPLYHVLPDYLHHLKVVNLAGEPLAKSWKHFIYGRLANNNSRIITMDGESDEITKRWYWKYYWMGDGHKRTCENWSSNYLMDVADVWAMNYQRQRIVKDVASCSTKLNLLCYSVCDEHDRLL